MTGECHFLSTEETMRQRTFSPLLAASWVNVGTCSNVATADSVWYVWNDQHQSAASTSNATAGGYIQAIWNQWNNNYNDYYAGQAHQQALQAQQSGAQQSGLGSAAYYEAELAYRLTELAARQAAQDAATERARLLLLDSLNERQAEDFKRTKTFIVHSKDGERVYQVGYGTAGNVRELKNGIAVAKYCIHPEGGHAGAGCDAGTKIATRDR